MAGPRFPRPLELVKANGLLVFGRPYSANLVVQRGAGLPGDWDGLLTLSWLETVGGAWTTLSARCATRPGVPFLLRPMHPRGTAMIAPGQHRLSHARGFHHPGTSRASAAWVQVGRLLVRRDNDGDEILEPGELVDDVTSANIHRIGSPDGLAGCIGVDPGPLDEQLEAFDVLHSRLPQPRVSLTIAEDR